MTQENKLAAELRAKTNGGLSERLHDSLVLMANNCSVPMGLWSDHCNLVLEAVAALSRIDELERGKGGEAVAWVSADALRSIARFELCAIFGSNRQTSVYSVPLFSTPPSPSVDRSVEGSPIAWLVETFSDDGKECLNSQFVVIPSVAAQFNKPYHRVTPLYASPVEGLRERVETLEMALRTADDAIAYYLRYLDGGEMRGSYDGKPERDALRKAGYATKAALSPPTPDGA